MANICDYEVRVKGSKNAGLMVYESMPIMDLKEFIWSKGSGNSTVVYFSGNCAWSVNYGVNDNLHYVNVNSMSAAKIKDKADEYYDYSLRAKSEAFQCEIMVHYWSADSGFDQFDHYKNGKLLKQRKIEYTGNEDAFDWNKLEFIGHEGEYDESVDGEAQDAAFMGMLLGLGGVSMSSGKSGVNKENEPDSIDENEEYLYNWTFKEGNTLRENGWTIAIPDGFKSVKSPIKKNPISGETCRFEIVPNKYNDEEEIASADVRIFSQSDLSEAYFGDNWMVHPNAKAGILGAICADTMERFPDIMKDSAELLSTGWLDAGAFVSFTHTLGITHHIQIVAFTEKWKQVLNIIACFWTDYQKQVMKKSIIRWLHTMKFDETYKGCPQKAIIEEENLADEIVKKGITKRFDEAVEQAVTEYNTAVNGKLKMIRFMGEHGVLDEHTADYIREILTDGMAVKEFYLEKAAELIKKVQRAGVGNEVLKKLIIKLHELDEDVTEIILDEEGVNIDVPARIVAIRNEWSKIDGSTPKYNVKPAPANNSKTKEKKGGKQQKTKDTKETKVAKKVHVEPERRTIKPIEEEKKHVESFQEKRDREMAEWQAEVDKINANREAEKVKRLNQYEQEYKSRVADIQSRKTKDIEAANGKISELRKRIEKDKTELNSLGFFKFARKKELKLSIKTDSNTIIEVERSIHQIEEKALNEGTETEANYEKKKADLDSDLNREFAIPDSPIEAEHKKRIREENEKNMRIILDILSSGGAHTVPELQVYSELSSLSNQKITSLCHELKKEGKVRRLREGRIVTYEAI